MEKKIFISYSRKNIHSVKSIMQEIEQNLYQGCCWIDLKGIESGTRDFWISITNAINSCPVFLFMMSEASQESENALDELDFAYEKHRKEGKHVVIVKIESCEMTDLFFRYKRDDIIDWNNHEQHEKLMSDLKEWVGIGVTNNQEGTILQEEPRNVDEPTLEVKQENFESDLDYEDAIDFWKDNELQDAMLSLQTSFEKGNPKAEKLMNKILFQNFGIKDWDEETWRFLDAQSKRGASFAHLAYFYKLQRNKAMYDKAALHLKAAMNDSKNGYTFLCEGISKERGIGCRAHLQSAMKRYELAYKMGINEACSYIAEMYLKGSSGVAINREKAIAMLQEGAKQGDARSCHVLGKVYADSHNKEHDKEKAIECFEKAIDLQMHEAWISLGKLYQKDRFSGQKNDKALQCYLEALKHGIKDAHAYIAQLYWNDYRQEDAVLEAQKGLRADNVRCASLLGKFFEEGLQDEQIWTKAPKPDYKKAWEYYQRAFALGGRIEDAISMARLYVNEEYRPEDMTWEIIEEYLEQGSQVPIIEAIELMVKALRKNGKESEAVKYIKIGAKSGSLPMKHEYGIYMQSKDEGEALRNIEEAGKKHYRLSVEWLMNHYSTKQTYSGNNYLKWMKVAIDMGIEISLKDYVELMILPDPKTLWKYLINIYEQGKLEALYWMAKYQSSFNLTKDKQDWLVNEMAKHYKKLVTYNTDTYEIYADILILSERKDLYELLIEETSTIAPVRGKYFQLRKKIKYQEQKKEDLKKLYQETAFLHNKEGLTMEWRIRFQNLMNEIVQKADGLTQTWTETEYHNLLSTKTILVVDDVPLNILLIKKLLSKETCCIISAPGGQKCLDIIKKEKPDIITLDIMMPGIDGCEVLRRLKSSPDTWDIPIIVVSALNSVQDISHYYTLGAAEFINKPIIQEKFLTAIKTQFCLQEAHRKMVATISQ